jgi:hypothetical protein
LLTSVLLLAFLLLLSPSHVPDIHVITVISAVADARAVAGIPPMVSF